MNIKAKIVSISVTAALLLSVSAQSFAATNPFTDITNSTVKEEILVLQEKGIVNGIGNDLFAPDASITAAQSIQLLVNALDLNLDLIRFIKEPKATDYFTKANNDAWYADALIIASVHGLELPNDLDPNQKWSREEFTYHLIQAMETKGNLPMIKLVPVKVVDQDQFTASYDGAVQRAFVYGITKLDAEGKFNPKAEISRAEAADQIYKALEYLKTHPAPQE